MRHDRDRDYDREHDRDRDRDYYHGDDARDDPRHRQRGSPGRGRDRYYHDYDDPRDRYNRSRSGAASPYDSADDDYYRERRHRSGPGRPYHTIKLDDIPDTMSTQEVSRAGLSEPYIIVRKWLTISHYRSTKSYGIKARQDWLRFGSSRTIGLVSSNL